MLYALIFVCSGVIFAQLLRFAQQRRANLPAVIAINYSVAVLGCAVFRLPAALSSGNLDCRLIVAGVATGLLYILHMMVLLRCYRAVGVGITSAVVGVAVIVPILAARAIWAEQITPLQWIAVVLMPAAILLMRPRPRHRVELHWKEDLLLLANFVLAGTIFTIHKSMTVIAPSQSFGLYQTSLFATAAGLAVGYLIFRRLRPLRFEIIVGSMVAVSNVICLTTMLLALKALSAAIAFPTTHCSVIAFNLIVARLLWQERLQGRQLIGVALALGIILLVNLGR